MARKVKSGAAAAPLFAAREKLPRRDAMRLLALMAGTLCAMMVIMIIAVTPERLNLSAGDIAPATGTSICAARPLPPRDTNAGLRRVSARETGRSKQYVSSVATIRLTTRLIIKYGHRQASSFIG